MRPLTEADLPRAAALSFLIGWNQVASDWSLFLRHGEGRAVDDGQDSLAATAAVIRHGGDLAWISMVLVRPDQRRRGHATALMRWAIGALGGTACIALDATPAGQPVYRQLGFRALWGFARWSLPSPLPAGGGVRPVTDADWPALIALDTAAFGAPRPALLRDFAARLPQAAFIAADGSGFALARDGARGPQIGPVVAADGPTARALVAAARNALAGAVVLDLPDRHGPLAGWLARHGGAPLRPFTRMALGAGTPGDASRIITVAGPEFG